ncbi:MAG: VTT domain-containing protein [Gemmatimonadaceae bacterium]|nr:VTT domain-containing protein [Gemmatimonadaceae bacterium]
MTLFERLWKYTALGASSIVGEETNPILGGIAIRHGRAGVIGVVVAVAVGTWVASLLLYAVGRWRIDWVRQRWPERQRLLDAALEIVRRHPWRASLAVRFAYGLRLPLPIACGAARLSFTLYTIATGISCWVWAGVFTWIGYVAGGAALRLLHFTTRLDVRLGVLAVILVVVLGFIMRRRRIAERSAKILSGEHIDIMTTAERERPPWPRGLGKH